MDNTQNQGREVEVEQLVETLRYPLTNTFQNAEYDHSTRSNITYSLEFPNI